MFERVSRVERLGSHPSQFSQSMDGVSDIESTEDIQDEEEQLPGSIYQESGRSELLAQVQALQGKLELSASIGNELLEREDEYRAEIDKLQDKLWHMEEDLSALRLQNSSLTAELFSIRQDNISWSLQLAEIDESRQSLNNRKADQSFEVSTIHELQIQMNKLQLENSELNDKLTEARLEAEARARIFLELQNRAQSTAKRPVSSTRRPVSATRGHVSSSVARLSESLFPPNPPHDEAGGDVGHEASSQSLDAHQSEVQELEGYIDELTNQIEQQELMIQEMKEDLRHYRSVAHLAENTVVGSFDSNDGTSFALELQQLALNTASVPASRGALEGVDKAHMEMHDAMISELREQLSSSRRCTDKLVNDYNRLQLLSAVLLICILFVVVALQGLVFMATH